MAAKAPKREPPLDPNPNHNRSPAEEAAAAEAAAPPQPQPVDVDGASEDEALRGAAALTREEVLRRRRRRARQLAGVYRGLYWALAEEVRARHREYVWEFGRSPVEAESEASAAAAAGGGEAGGGAGGAAKAGKWRRCGFAGCKLKAMAMTRFCHGHILSDPKQTLYKGCCFVIKSSAQTGQITCGRPILRAAVPSFCSVHLQKTQKNIAQAYKKAGLNPSSTSKTCPKFNVLVAEGVRQIQTKRRECLNVAMHKIHPINGKVP